MTAVPEREPARRSAPSHVPASRRLRSHLIATGELATLVDAPREARNDIVLVDATVVPVRGFDGHPAYVTGHEQYLVSGHIPGAVFADLIEEFSDPDGAFAFARPDPERFARAAGALGIGRDTLVVVYDGALGQWAARLWWLFRSFGHERVSVLDGGLRKWMAEGRRLDVGHVTPSPSTGYSVEEVDGYWADKERVHRALSGEQPAALLCGLAPREFSGETGHRPRLGHIPGSISVPAARLIDRETNAFLPDEALRAVLADALASPAPVVAYCAGGVLASADALALALLGRDDVSVYDGSLNEWAADEAAPLVITA